MKQWEFPQDRYFDPDPQQKKIAVELYETVENLPILCPHGHVDPNLFVEENGSFGSPAEMLIVPDHYVFRMLYSQGVAMEDLGVPRADGQPVSLDGRKIWQLFADRFYLFRGTPTGIWLSYELYSVFGIQEKLTSENAQAIYDQIEAKLAQAEYAPRRLFERFNIEVLSTTDAAYDRLEPHQKILASGWKGRVIPAFRPDAVVNLDTENWKSGIEKLSASSGIYVHDYVSFIQALETSRAFFKSMGAVATDHAVINPVTGQLPLHEVEAIFQRALAGKASADDATLFAGHMLIEMARMSVEDGLVMQIHPGSYRNHNQQIFERYGRDKGCDIPVQTEYTRNLLPLLNRYGNDPRLRLVLFTLDETSYSRELAPLAGHYPALRLGPPWWFHDSLNGMKRFFDQVTETAGLYNTAGFNDDTRAFPSIPVRHDVWRRASANWVAGLVVRHIVDMDDAREMIYDLAYGLTKSVYRLG